MNTFLTIKFLILIFSAIMFHIFHLFLENGTWLFPFGTCLYYYFEQKKEG